MTRNRRGQALVEFVLSVPLMMTLLIGFVASTHLLRRHLLIEQGIRLALQLRLAGLDDSERIKQILRSCPGLAAVGVDIARFDETAAARFYRLDQVTVFLPPSSIEKYVFQFPPAGSPRQLVIQPPEEN